MADLEKKLQSKCSKVLGWHNPSQSSSENGELKMAKMSRLPSVLSQHMSQHQKELTEVERIKKEIIDTLAMKHKVILNLK